MPLKLMYITNNPLVALIAEKYGTDLIFIDLETLGKDIRQKNRDTVKSHHTFDDIKNVRKVIKKSELLVRINPINPKSEIEISQVIDYGADIIMLPMWKYPQEVESFIKFVNGRVKTMLLLETKEAVENIDTILTIKGIDNIHIGLNDLHMSFNLKFMFELLSNGIVETLCKKISHFNIPYGFGGIAKLGEGTLSSENIIIEHYRLGSTQVILSRSFCDTNQTSNIAEIEQIFKNNISKLRGFEEKIKFLNYSEFENNKIDVENKINEIVKNIEKK